MDGCEVLAPIPRPRDGSDEYYGAGNDLYAAANAISASLPRGRTTTTSLRAHSSRATKRRTGSRLLAVGATLSVAFTFVLVMVLAAHGPAVKHATLSSSNAPAQRELTALANAETAYYATTSSYTTDSNMLFTAGYRPAAGDKMIVFAGTQASGGFCAGAGVAGSSSWVIYDSNRGGLTAPSYPTKDAAQIACAAGTSMWFDTIG